MTGAQTERARQRWIATTLSGVVVASLACASCRKDEDLAPKKSAAPDVGASTSPYAVLDAGPPPPTTPADTIWISEPTVDKTEVRFLVEEEVPRPIKALTVATYAYDTAGKQLAREVRTIAASLRPEASQTYAFARVVDGASTYVPIVFAVEYVDGATPWSDPSIASATRPLTKQSSEGLAFAGNYASTEGTASITQDGDRITINYEGGHARCLAHGKSLTCAWHESADYGAAALVREADGKLNGTWGVGKSATDGGDWHFIPTP